MKRETVTVLILAVLIQGCSAVTQKKHQACRTAEASPVGEENSDNCTQ